MAALKRKTMFTVVKRLHLWKRLTALSVILLGGYLGIAYLAMPAAWNRYVHRHPALEDVPHITYTADGIPGDPLNVALIGRETELTRIMLASGWHPADPLTLRSCLAIARDTIFKRPDPDAPVSNLFLLNRQQDLAFEQSVGNSPRQRHHVRFWHWDTAAMDGRPIWIGAATYDRKVGLSHTTGQVTHHIAVDTDAERDHLFQSLEKTGNLSEVYFVDGFHKKLTGRNGGGDVWHTDGRLEVGVLAGEQPFPLPPP
jgi:LssY C-terminus